MNRVKKIAALTILLAVLVACAVSPTGRKQLVFMPESQMIVMGVQSFEQMRQQTALVKDAAIIDYVQCVADAITRLPEVRESSNDWEVVVFDDKSVNAFALPGGKIGVYKGLLPVANSPDQLAAVLGHEVGHVQARHGNERVSQNFAVGQSLALLEGWMASKNYASRQQAMGLIGVGAQVGVLLPFSREHESEADEIGQVLMAKAGFDPRQSITLWQNMGKDGKAPPEFLSTHPSHKTRIRELQSGMDNALQYYQATRVRPACRMPAIQ